ncbi:MAG TPA: glycosyltransferase family 2 protein [Gaiellaceae bacterium]|jgi:biofilm PGA synthesis N-glycosyltransferase PgaC|nr:glycosyltransferase family 2 protein [Gaiellaceae bacterium]
MTARLPSYAVVTPARNEAENLMRLGRSLAAQTMPPDAWIVVENGSTDASLDVASALAHEYPWIRVAQIQPTVDVRRGGPIVRAFNEGVARLERPPDIIVKLDADVSMEPDYFERVLGAFAADQTLGIASGSAYEQRDGDWRQLFLTRTAVWGAARAYRLECLRDVSPLEERMGWDGVDELKANLRGWSTRTLADVPFRHHRREGERDGARRKAWQAQGEVAHFMGYRISYLLLRALHRARHEPAALAMVIGFVRATLRREERCLDPAVRSYLRRQQRLRELPLRAREALGYRAP